MAETIDPNADIPLPIRVRNLEQRDIKILERIEEATKECSRSIKELKDKQHSIDRRVENLEMQVGRLMSHIESEVGLARRDITETRKEIKDSFISIKSSLFGKEDEADGGRIGAINKEITRFKIWALGVISAGSILVFLFAAYYFVTNFTKK